MSGVADLTIPIDKEVVDGMRQLRVWHWQKYRAHEKRRQHYVDGGWSEKHQVVQSQREQATMHMKIVQLLNCFVDSTADEDEKKGY